MLSLLEQLSELATADDTEGMVNLLEAWPERDYDWITAVGLRLRAPSSTLAQRARLQALQKAWHEGNSGSDLS